MQEQTNKVSVKYIDTFDDEVSLWHLIGGGNGLKLLQKIADTYYVNEKRDHPFSLLLSGRQSTTLYGVCFLRSLAMQISRISAQMLYVRDGLVELFTPAHADRGFIIEDVEQFNMGIQPKIIQILQDGNFTQYDCSRKCNETYPVFGIIVLTCKDIKEVIPQITKSADYVIHVDDLNREQIRQIIKMRLKYANVGYENEKVIDMLATGSSLRMIVSIMRIAYGMMLFENRSVITEQDVLKARECL
jgi:hypothetical protein